MDIPIEVVAYLAIFLGVLLRTILPAIKKFEQQEHFEFEIKYVFSAIVVLITSGVTTFAIFGTFTIPEGTMFQIFVAAFLIGWGANDMFNRLMK